jgi:hypothetical protein
MLKIVSFHLFVVALNSASTLHGTLSQMTLDLFRMVVRREALENYIVQLYDPAERGQKA